jgi:hypothetical protein
MRFLPLIDEEYVIEHILRATLGFGSAARVRAQTVARRPFP